MERSKIEGHGDCIHFWAHGKIVFDTDGALKKLQAEARELWKNGPEQDIQWKWRWDKHHRYIID